VDSLNEKNINQFAKVKKIVMAEEESLDIDTPLDWEIAELLISKKNGS
jgi:N-acylneuraminate cytidylyltransferase